MLTVIHTESVPVTLTGSLMIVPNTEENASTPVRVALAQMITNAMHVNHMAHMTKTLAPAPVKMDGVEKDVPCI